MPSRSRQDDRLTSRRPGVDELQELTLLKDARKRVVAGESLHAICREWTAKGIETPRRGKAWYPETVKRILLNPRNAGLIAHYGTILIAEKGHLQRYLDSLADADAKGRMAPGSPIRTSIAHSAKAGMTKPVASCSWATQCSPVC